MQPQEHQLQDPIPSPLACDGAPTAFRWNEAPLHANSSRDAATASPATEAMPVADTARAIFLGRIRRWLAHPVVQGLLGLLVGCLMLYLIARFVDIPTTLRVLRTHLATTRGLLLALLSGLAFLTALALRGLRWRFFLNSVSKVGVVLAIQVFLIGSFLNFLLPVRGGELAKSLILKRVAAIPISRSLPTVAMDKALDLLPAFFIMAMVPFLGVQMTPLLWFVLALVGGLLLLLSAFTALAAWQRRTAIALLHSSMKILPGVLGRSIEGFAINFVDALLIGASQPRIFIPAALLTLVAVVCEGLFAMLAFWTVGYPISFGTALFGYTLYNMFFVLPTPPGQIGSNEVNGLLVFHGLLNIDARYVTAMFIFSHPWAALMLSVAGLSNLSALGLNVRTAMHTQIAEEEENSPATSALL